MSAHNILLVHGRDFKPAHDVLLDISLQAIRAGIERDYPDHVEAYDMVSKDMAYFGDLSNELLESSGKTYDETLDVGDRNHSLASLRKVPARKRFGIRQPRIRVCGLNPHAGEDGHIGREELDIIIPTLQALRAEGLAVEGPFPADTVFTTDSIAQCDAILAMYHDQGLPVLKHASFGRAINVTLGLPIIRTSVDHGTALDLAGTGRASSGSLEAAIACAIEMTGRSH